MGYLIAYAATVSTVVGMLALLMITHLTGARWFEPMRPRAEPIVAVLPWLATLFIPIVLLAPHLYPWARPETLDPALRAFVEMRSGVLNLVSFTLRSALYLGCWIAIAALLRRASAGMRDDPARAIRQWRRVSAIGLPALGVTLTFAGFDWFMTLSLPWHSAIYSLYYFAGGFVSAVALLGLLAVSAAPRANDTGPVASPDQLHALGKVLLTGLLLWVYLGFAQYLIIWMGDLPREVTWYLARGRDGWGRLGLAILAGHFALPFVLLLPRETKRNRLVLVAVGYWLPVMHLVNTVWFLLPESAASPGLAVLFLLLALAAILVSSAGVLRWVAGRTASPTHATVPRPAAHPGP